MPKSFLALLIATGPLVAADWPHWRGPTRDGRTDEPSGLGRQAVAARQAGLDRQRRSRAPARRSSSATASIALGRSGGHDVVRCLDAQGRQGTVGGRYAGPKYGRFHDGDEGLYSGPSSTPEYDPETKLLYTLGPDGDLRCWDTAAERQGGLGPEPVRRLQGEAAAAAHPVADPRLRVHVQPARPRRRGCWSRSVPPAARWSRSTRRPARRCGRPS